MSGARFELHGLVSVEVVGDPADVAVVARQIGPPCPPGAGAVGPVGPVPAPPAADLVVEFVDRLETGPLTFLGRADFAYDDTGFVVLRGKHKASIKARLPFEDLGRGARIVVERGAPAVPLLVAVLNLLALANGGVAVHAAALAVGERGAVITGWSKGGKTETLLAMLGAGARYVGDEWVYLDPAGRWAGGVAEPIRVWDWYLPQIGPLAGAVGRGDRWRLAGLRLASRGGDAIDRAAPHARATRVVRRSRHLLEQQRFVDLAPARLVGAATAGRASFDVLIHAVSADVAGASLVEADPADVAARIAASLANERAPLREAYHAFRYAFPERRSPLVESAERVEAERLPRLFAAKRCVELRHPYPPDLAELRALVAPLLESGS